MNKRLKTIIAVTITVAIYPMVANAIEKENKTDVNNRANMKQIVIKMKTKN